MRKVFLIAIAAAAWAGLVLELYMTLDDAVSSGGSIRYALINYLSFFTILSNFMIAALCTVAALDSRAPSHAFRQTFAAALTLYIVIVAAVDAAILKSGAHAVGIEHLSDLLLHKIVPAAYAIYWVGFEPKDKLAWGDPLLWQGFPIVYMMYTMIRGELTHYYPYPFLNADHIGTDAVWLNGLYLLGFLLAISYAILGIGKAAALWHASAEGFLNRPSSPRLRA